MALRKEDLDADDEQRDNAKKRSRITIDLSPELRRRIKLAALQNDLPIGEYVGRILEQTVPDEASMIQRQRRPVTNKTLERLSKISDEIMESRGGKLFEDSTEMIRQMREERTEELMQAVTAQNDEEEESTTTEQIVPDEANKASRQWRPVTSETFERLRQIREEIMKDRNGRH